MCPFSKIKVIGAPRGPMTFLTIGSCLSNGASYGFHPVEEFKFNQQVVVYSMILLPLFY